MAVVTGDARRRGLRARLRSLPWPLALIPLGVACAFLAAVFGAGWLYADRVLPGVTVGGIEAGSLTRTALVERLDRDLADRLAGGAVVATAGGKTWTTTNAVLGIGLDVDAAADAALAYGKSGRALDQAAAWIGALRGEARVPLALRATDDRLERWLGTIASEVDRPAISGRLATDARGLQAIEPSLGRRLDRATSAALLLAADATGDRSLTLPVRDVYPEVDEDGFRDALARARAITTPLAIVADDRRVTADPAALAALMRIERLAAAPGDLPAIPGTAIAPPTRYRYLVTLDGDRLTDYVTMVAAQLDREGHDARFTVSKQGVLGVVPGVNGIQVDQVRTRRALAAALFVPSETPVREIAAVSAVDATSFTTEQAREWLPKLVRTSSFTTYFPANASRHANIATGSRQFDGVVIAPGATFSFWQLLGPVTPERGYAYAGAIIQNRSDENVIGGGLCQVSTTMFNAIARLGYEIVERHEHAYLIERYPLGLDAAVFDPGLDFRWRNDTASPVFLWSWVSDTSVTFDVWGLPTGRTVTFSDPVQWNFVDVPPDQPADPAFPAGYAIRGRDAMRIRTVTANGAVLYRDTWTSHYVPVWGGPAPAGTPLTVH